MTDLTLTPNLAEQFSDFLHQEAKQTVVLEGIKAFAKQGALARPHLKTFLAHPSTAVQERAALLLEGGE